MNCLQLSRRMETKCLPEIQLEGSRALSNLRVPTNSTSQLPSRLSFLPSPAYSSPKRRPTFYLSLFSAPCLIVYLFTNSFLLRQNIYIALNLPFTKLAICKHLNLWYEVNSYYCAPSISRTFLSSQTETSYQLNNTVAPHSLLSHSPR